MQAKNLPYLLKELREKAGLSREKMAETLGISASYISILENINQEKPKIPSIDLLQKYVSRFSYNQPRLIFKILLSAVKFDRNFTLPIGSLRSEADRRKDKEFYEEWTLSDVIPENIDKALFTLICNKIRDGSTRYVYFIPDGSEQWEILHERLVCVSGITETTITNSVVCIETSRLICGVQTFIGLSKIEGIVGASVIGHSLQSDIYPLQDYQAFEWWKTLKEVIRRFRDERDCEETLISKIIFKRIFP